MILLYFSDCCRNLSKLNKYKHFLFDKKTITVQFIHKYTINKQKTQLIAQINQLIKTGYSKSELARSLAISRSSLIKLLSDPDYLPSRSLLNRSQTNLEWLQKSAGHELLEAITLIYCQNKQVLKYFNSVIKKAEEETGFFVGYHGITFGGPVGFMFLHTPGIDPMTEIFNDQSFEQEFGYTETFIIGNIARHHGDHKFAGLFYAQHPQARIYLKFFKNYSLSSKKDLHEIIKLFSHPKFQSSIYCLEAGLILGRYDYFLLLVAKDELAYLDFLTCTDGVYNITGHSQTDSITLPVTPPCKKPLFQENYYNLSFSPNSNGKFGQ